MISRRKLGRAAGKPLAAGVALLGALAVAGCDLQEDADLERGRDLFIAKCGTCHVLAEASTTADIGPNLDDAFAAARETGMDQDTIEGVVQHGDKRGRELGYPTANLALGDYLRPRFGIYAVRGHLPGGRTVDGVANLGLRPQFEPVELLEPFFFNFSGDLYGETIAVDLVSFIRPEAKFDSLATLIAQMDADSARAKAILSGR